MNAKTIFNATLLLSLVVPFITKCAYQYQQPQYPQQYPQPQYSQQYTQPQYPQQYSQEYQQPQYPQQDYQPYTQPGSLTTSPFSPFLLPSQPHQYFDSTQQPTQGASNTTTSSAPQQSPGEYFPLSEQGSSVKIPSHHVNQSNYLTAKHLRLHGDYKAAGVLPYSKHKGETLILLGFNPTRHNNKGAWEDFGGGRDRKDNNIMWKTAKREFTEETKRAFPELHFNPSYHYIQNGSAKYFMFFVQVPYIDNRDMNHNVRPHDEKKAFAWVSANDLYHAIVTNSDVPDYYTRKPLHLFHYFVETLKLNPEILRHI